MSIGGSLERRQKLNRTFSTDGPWVGTAFEYQILEDLKETMQKTYKENLKVIVERVCILFCYILSPDRKHQSGLAKFSLRQRIRGQLFYDQSSSPCKSFRLNGEYRYLQPLLPQSTYYTYIFSCFCQEIKLNGGKP